MKYTLQFIILVSLLFSCGKQENGKVLQKVKNNNGTTEGSSSGKTSKLEDTFEENSGQTSAMKTNRNNNPWGFDKILSQIDSFHFSSKSHKDLFKIGLKGTSIQDATFHFLIESNAGEVLYRYDGFSTDLITPEYMVYSSLEENFSEKNIEKAFSEFFKGFVRPAINLDSGESEYNPMYSAVSQEIWDKIKENKDSIGFCFGIENSSLCITFYDNSVLLYEACC